MDRYKENLSQIVNIGIFALDKRPSLAPTFFSFYN